MGQDHCFSVDCNIGMVNVVPFKHFQKQHAASCPDHREFLHLGSPLLFMGVNRSFQQNYHLIAIMFFNFRNISVNLKEDLRFPFNSFPEKIVVVKRDSDDKFFFLHFNGIR